MVSVDTPALTSHMPPIHHPFSTAPRVATFRKSDRATSTPVTPTPNPALDGLSIRNVNRGERLDSENPTYFHNVRTIRVNRLNLRFAVFFIVPNNAIRNKRGSVRESSSDSRELIGPSKNPTHPDPILGQG